MSQSPQAIEALRQTYESVKGVPASFQKTREEAIAVLSQQGWITEDAINCLTSAPDADVIEKEIALLYQKSGTTPILIAQFQLAGSLASYHEQLFSIEIEVEERYRGELENIAERLPYQVEPSGDAVLEGFIAESEALKTKLRDLQEQAEGLRQAIDNQHQEAASDGRQQLVQALAVLQKQELQLNRELLYNRQAQTLNKLGAPQRVKKKLLASRISQLEAKKLVQDLITHSLERSALLEKIRFNLQKAISDAQITQAQNELVNMNAADPVRYELLRPRTQRVDWF